MVPIFARRAVFGGASTPDGNVGMFGNALRYPSATAHALIRFWATSKLINDFAQVQATLLSPLIVDL